MKKEEYTQLVKEWIKDLSTSFGEELVLDDEGICSFRIEDDTIITIEISPDFPVVYLYSPIMTLPADEPELGTALMIKALELNAFQALTRGGAIASIPGGGLLVYCYTQSIEGVDFEGFSKILGGFYETALELKKLLILPEKKPEETQVNPSINLSLLL